MTNLAERIMRKVNSVAPLTHANARWLELAIADEINTEKYLDASAQEVEQAEPAFSEFGDPQPAHGLFDNPRKLADSYIAGWEDHNVTKAEEFDAYVDKYRRAARGQPVPVAPPAPAKCTCRTLPCGKSCVKLP